MMDDYLKNEELLNRLEVILRKIFNDRLEVGKSFLSRHISVKFFTDTSNRDWNIAHLHYLLENYFIEEKISYGTGWNTTKGYLTIVELDNQPLQFYSKNKLESLMLAVEELIKYLGVSK